MRRPQIGDVVQIGPRYIGAGQYAPDEWTGGPFTVVGVMPPSDYKLCRGTFAETPGSGEWDVIVHASRVSEALPTCCRVAVQQGGHKCPICFRTLKGPPCSSLSTAARSAG